MILSDKSELVLELKKLLPPDQFWLLGIDGEQGAGKTTISQYLANELGATKLSGDDYVRRGRLLYPEIIDMKGLSAAINKIKAENKPVIFESVMLQLILEAANIKPTATLYIRQISPNGEYTNAHLFDCVELENAIKDDRKISELIFKDDKYYSLTTEGLLYHRDRKPHINSTLVFNNHFGIGS